MREPDLETAKLRRLAKTKRVGDCWIWDATVDSWGYGITDFKRERWKAHRLFYTWFRGPIPDGMLVCHKCDTPSCVNPDHLFLGTPKDNMDDMLAKGRGNPDAQFKRGEQNSRTILTPDKVLKIREDYAAGRKQKEIAGELGISHKTVCSIVTRRNWAHI